MVAALPAAASAQGLFDFLFRSPRRQGPPPNASAYADPYPSFNGSRHSDSDRRSTSAGGPGVFCVRLCDGRYFPMQRSAANSTQLCNSFCPAAQTKVFSGGGIDNAVASDGTRYANIGNAFAYRQRMVENCTCNGRDPYGLVTLEVNNDPTLRNGDIVATNEGFVAYTSTRRQAEFTPIDATYSGLTADWRERFAHTKITPRNATPVSQQTLRDGATLIYDERGRRVQLDR